MCEHRVKGTVRVFRFEAGARRAAAAVLHAHHIYITHPSIHPSKESERRKGRKAKKRIEASVWKEGLAFPGQVAAASIPPLNPIKILVFFSLHTASRPKTVLEIRYGK